MTENQIGQGTFSIRRWVCACLLMLVIPVMLSCGGGGGGGGAVAISNPDSDKNITAFSFTDAANSALSQDVAGTISGTSITLTVPSGTTVTALVATFTTTGQTVRVGATIQTSGSTPNNFTNPVTYRVTAKDDSTKDYTVTVNIGVAPTGGIVANHLAAASFDSIPDTYITAAKNNLHIAYGHTSHGSQLITGMNALENYYGTKYNWNDGALAGALDI